MSSVSAGNDNCFPRGLWSGVFFMHFFPFLKQYVESWEGSDRLGCLCVRYGLQCVSPKRLCWSPNPQAFVTVTLCGHRVTAKGMKM